MNKIKYLVMDVDGTLTDGKIYIGDKGEAFKAFHVKDGYGIHDIAISAGICPVIITGRSSQILENRCRELGIISFYQGITDKAKKLDEFLTGELYARVAYIGDDINDISCMLAVKEGGGLVGCPADAVKRVKAIADFISTKNGGDGAVREFIEWLIEQNVGTKDEI